MQTSMILLIEAACVLFLIATREADVKLNETGPLNLAWCEAVVEPRVEWDENANA